MSRGMDGPETSEAKAEDKGEPEEAAAEIEAGGRRKEIADDTRSRLKNRDLFFMLGHPPPLPCFLATERAIISPVPHLTEFEGNSHENIGRSAASV